MKAISLWQPWASLWLSDAKLHETRHWPTRYRGWLGVHAAKTREGMDAALDDILKRHNLPEQLPFGALIGLVHLDDCRQIGIIDGAAPRDADDERCGNWTPGRYAWRRGLFRVFDQPIPYRGSQGFFEVSDDLIPRAAA